ncbi:MAG: hypothetical protein ACRC62_04860 [Microcoleus sp.]
MVLIGIDARGDRMKAQQQIRLVHSQSLSARNKYRCSSLLLSKTKAKGKGQLLKLPGIPFFQDFCLLQSAVNFANKIQVRVHRGLEDLLQSRFQ